MKEVANETRSKSGKLTAAKIAQIEELLLIGYSTRQVCSAVSMPVSSFREYCRKGREDYEGGKINTIYAKLALAVFRAEHEITPMVEEALVQSALGNKTVQKTRKVLADGSVVEEEKITEHPGNVTAQQFYLRNKEFKEWNKTAEDNKVEVTVTNIGIASPELAEDEWVAKYAQPVNRRENIPQAPQPELATPGIPQQVEDDEYYADDDAMEEEADLLP